MLGSKPRKFQRYVVEGMDIHARTVFNMEADVLDLSLSGASIQSTQRLNMGSTYTFKFTRGDNLTSVSGVVVWEKLVGTKKNEKGEMMPVYLAGVQFSDILTDKAQELIEYIKGVVGEAAGRRMAGIRLRLLEPKKAVVIQMENYIVTEVGLGGIRIETDQEFDPDIVLLFDLTPAVEEKSVHFTGRVAYCREIPGRETRMFIAGIEIVEIAAEEMVRWKELVEALSPGDKMP